MESKRKKNRHITEDTTTTLRTSIEKINGAMIKHAREIAHEIEANAFLVYVDLIKSRKNMEALIKGDRCILAARVQDVIDDLNVTEDLKDRILHVPYLNLTRLSQVKVAAILALSNRLIKIGDRLVCLCGSLKTGILDFLMVIEIGGEFEALLPKDLALPNQVEFSHVFDRLLTLSIELASEGKEGKPLGTIFVLGDHEKVVELSSQMVFNPFANVPEGERNILDSSLKETIREFASIDGAFIIRDDGVVLAAGRHLKASTEDADLPQGLGAKHRAAAGITALTNALAIVISESTGDVRIFSRGKIFMEIEKAAREQATS
jgi:DNA integrity scanning protein DisA with diadenylate cyclase activity